SVRHLPAAAAGEPPGPGDRGGREGLPKARRAARAGQPHIRPGGAVMLRFLPFALAALLAPVLAHADDAPAQPEAQAQATQRPLLWKVSDADNHVYLLG